MTRTLIGFDYTGTACIKVTKANYDPKTTLDERLERFLFSSKWRNHVAPAGLDKADLVTGSSAQIFTPSGSGYSNFLKLLKRSYGISGRCVYRYRKGYFPDLRYNLPLVDVSWQRISNGRFTQRRTWEVRVGQQNGSGVYGGYFATGAAQEMGWAGGLTMERGTTEECNLGYGTGLEAWNIGGGNTAADNGMHKRLNLWNLPGDDTPLDGPTTTPSPAGKMAIQITSAQCRVAKPGYDCRTAAPRYLAFDANNRAIRVIASADIAVPVGASSYNLGVAIPAETFADIHFYTGSTIQYPSHAREGIFGADYWFSGSSIHFDNPSVACRARLIVLAYDDAPATSGSNRVFRQFTDGGENHVQFLRPGAANPPSFADIVMDTRWPVLQILAEGYLPVGNGAQSHTVNYDGSGMFVFVKYATHHGAFQDALNKWTERVRAPFTKIVRWTNGAHGGDSTYVTYNQTSATFRTHKGAIINQYIPGSGGSVVTESDPNPIVGLRYYVLGIPL